MPLTDAQKEAFTPSPRGVGPQLIVLNPVAMAVVPTTLGNGASYVSGNIPANGWKSISVGAKTSLAGTITIQRYLDEACTMPVGAQITATITANTPQWATVNDGVAFVAYTVTVANTGGATSTVNYIQIIMGAS